VTRFARGPRAVAPLRPGAGGQLVALVRGLLIAGRSPSRARPRCRGACVPRRIPLAAARAAAMAMRRSSRAAARFLNRRRTSLPAAALPARTEAAFCMTRYGPARLRPPMLPPEVSRPSRFRRRRWRRPGRRSRSFTPAAPLRRRARPGGERQLAGDFQRARRGVRACSSLMKGTSRHPRPARCAQALLPVDHARHSQAHGLHFRERQSGRTARRLRRAQEPPRPPGEAPSRAGGCFSWPSTCRRHRPPRRERSRRSGRREVQLVRAS